jgi:hypothetical protein
MQFNSLEKGSSLLRFLLFSSEPPNYGTLYQNRPLVPLSHFSNSSYATQNSCRTSPNASKFHQLINRRNVKKKDKAIPVTGSGAP